MMGNVTPIFKILIFIVLLVASVMCTAIAKADEFSIITLNNSHHFDSNDIDYNETHDGIGVDWAFPTRYHMCEDFSTGLVSFKNSHFPEHKERSLLLYGRCNYIVFGGATKYQDHGGNPKLDGMIPMAALVNKYQIADGVEVWMMLNNAVTAVGFKFTLE